MAHPHQLKSSFGQKLSDVANTLKNIYSVGSTVYHVGKAVAPFVTALLYISRFI